MVPRAMLWLGTRRWLLMLPWGAAVRGQGEVPHAVEGLLG
jgi:hypothetical protein